MRRLWAFSALLGLLWAADTARFILLGTAGHSGVIPGTVERVQGLAPVEADPTPHCFVLYYRSDGNTYDQVKAGCTGLAPNFMVRVQAWMNLRHDGVFGNVWVNGPWVDCSWNADHPDQHLSTITWLEDNSGEKMTSNR